MTTSTNLCPLTGVILAGGQSRRMGGRPKALLPFGGEPIIRRQIAEMRKCCADVIVVTALEEVRDAVREAEGLEAAERIMIVADRYPDSGPLSGIHAAALAPAAGQYLWVVACDMPHISSAAALALLGCLTGPSPAHAAAVPYVQGQLHPLHAVYERSQVLHAAEQLLAQGRLRLQGLLEQLPWRQA
ncbi:MAG: formate dehydrogenase family accessory protein FdhD, partial [Paenibacillaceae bacterium]|nr:formate dehydrogenase family accessory protein FdhD [Paenibacillaceae bacterium]